VVRVAEDRFGKAVFGVDRVVPVPAADRRRAEVDRDDVVTAFALDDRAGGSTADQPVASRSAEEANRPGSRNHPIPSAISSQAVVAKNSAEDYVSACVPRKRIVP